MSDILDDIHQEKNEIKLVKWPIFIWSILLILALILKLLNKPGGFFFMVVIPAGFSGYICYKMIVFKWKNQLVKSLFFIAILWFIYLIIAINSPLPMSLNEKGIVVYLVFVLSSTFGSFVIDAVFSNKFSKHKYPLD